MKLAWCAAGVALISLGGAQVAAADAKDAGPESESVTEELKKSGKHLGHAAQIEAERTKKGFKRAAKEVGDATEKLRKDAEDLHRKNAAKPSDTKEESKPDNKDER